MRYGRQRGWRQLSIPEQLHRDFCLPYPREKACHRGAGLSLSQGWKPAGAPISVAVLEVPWAGGRWALSATRPSRRALLAMARG